MRFSILFAMASALLAQAPGSAPKAGAAPSGNAQNGKKLFVRDGCYQCHGLQGQGGAAGPRIGPRPIAFAAFTMYVRQPSGQMPPYTSKVVSDQELADIHAFLASLPQPPPVKSIPALNQ
ncbi:MAG: cytochrome c [Acidobacteriia bacterium]|nr:cytochrome c [Terriglobia bacterium]